MTVAGTTQGVALPQGTSAPTAEAPVGTPVVAGGPTEAAPASPFAAIIEAALSRRADVTGGGAPGQGGPKSAMQGIIEQAVGGSTQMSPDAAVMQAIIACRQGMPVQQSSVAGSYTVQAGDSLSAIAPRFGITWQELYRANQHQIADPNLIHPGQVLVVPGAGPTVQGPFQGTPPTQLPPPPGKGIPMPPGKETPPGKGIPMPPGKGTPPGTGTPPPTGGPRQDPPRQDPPRQDPPRGPRGGDAPPADRPSRDAVNPPPPPAPDGSDRLPPALPRA